MSQPRLFEDKFDFEPEHADMPVSSGEAGSWNYHYVLVGLIVGATVIAIWFMGSSIINDRGSVTLTGSEVSQLRPGAAVMLDGKQVGEVQQVEIRDGLPTARLRVDPEVLQEIPSTSRLQVGSLNRVLPGNIGVKIVSAEHNEAIAGAGWETIHERFADQSIVPTGTPLGFYVVLFVVVAIAVLLLSLVIKVLRSTAFWAAIVVAMIVVVLHAWHTGKLDETARWGHEHLKASQSTGTPSR